MQVLIGGALYFALVFVAAFALGAVRTFFVAPALGETAAVAIEAPFFIAAVIFAARFTLRRIAVPRTAIHLFAMSAFGLLLQQAAEMMLVLRAGQTLAQHGAYLSTPAGMIYLALLATFLVMPWLLRKTKSAAW